MLIPKYPIASSIPTAEHEILKSFLLIPFYDFIFEENIRSNIEI